MNLKHADLVSVIIPTLNEEANLEICLRSIKNQIYKNLEIIVIDNFSKDKTIEIATKYTELIFQKGNERSAQRNFGAQKATGYWLLFVDSDQEISKNLVKDAVRTTNKHKLDAIVIPETVKGETFWAKCLALEKSLYQDQSHLWAARFFKKSSFLKLGGFDENLIAGEDWDLHQRTIKAGFKVGKINSKIYNLEGDTSLAKILKKKFYYAKHIKKYAQKHPQVFINQANLIGRLFSFSNFSTMIKDPIHAAGLIFLKTTQAAVGIIGLIF